MARTVARGRVAAVGGLCLVAAVAARYALGGPRRMRALLSSTDPSAGPIDVTNQVAPASAKAAASAASGPGSLPGAFPLATTSKGALLWRCFAVYATTCFIMAGVISLLSSISRGFHP